MFFLTRDTKCAACLQQVYPCEFPDPIDWWVRSEAATARRGFLSACARNTHQGVFLSCLYSSRMEVVAVNCLVQELQSSPAVCDLIQLQLGADIPRSPALPGGGEQSDSQSLSAEVLQLTSRTLFEECQQRTCMSSDTTLAMKGLSDQNPVLLQVHRYW